MILDDYDMVTVVSEQQERNAYAAAAWRLQYQRRSQCPDPRNDFLRLLGKLNDACMEKARAYVRLSERTRLAIQRALQVEVDRRIRTVVPFRSQERP